MSSAVPNERMHLREEYELSVPGASADAGVTHPAENTSATGHPEEEKRQHG